MKRRMFAFFLGVVMLCSLAAGCFAQPEPTQPLPPPETTQPTQPTQPPETLPTEPPEPPEPQDLFSRCGQAALPAPTALPAYALQTETPFLYACDIPLGYLSNITPTVSGNVLYLYCWDDDTYCEMYDLTDGSHIRRVELGPFFAWGELENGGLWAVNYSMLQVVFYDRQGNEFEMFSLQEPLPEDQYLHSVKVSRDGRYLLTTYDAGDVLEIREITTGELRLVEIPQGLKAWGLEEYRDGFLVNNYDRDYYFLNLEEGVLEPWSTDQSVGTLHSGVFHYYHSNALVLDAGPMEPERFYLDFSESEYLCDLDFGCAITQFYGDMDSVRFYDLRRECLLAEVPLDENSYLAHAEFMNDGRVLLTVQVHDTTSLYFYDLPALWAQTQGTPADVLFVTDEQLLQQTDLLAQQIMEATGVELLYGSQGNDFILYDYVGVALLDPYSVYHSVKEVGRILQRYPQGMLRESYEETHQGLRIYLCDQIHGIQSAGVSLAAGVTSEVDGYIIIALHADSDPDYDLPHELSHVFDRRINWVDLQEDTNWMNVWEEFTPIPDCYLYSYADYSWYTDYTADGWDTEVWFVDGYARTYPTEDRARIMEHLANMDQEFSAELLHHENLRNKARLYAYILRQCFPSCNTEQTHFWEEGMGVIDASVLQSVVG